MRLLLFKYMELYNKANLESLAVSQNCQNLCSSNDVIPLTPPEGAQADLIGDKGASRALPNDGRSIYL